MKRNCAEATRIVALLRISARTAVALLATALWIVGAPMVHAQAGSTPSDAYICAHGDPNEDRTVQACDRKDIGNERPPSGDNQQTSLANQPQPTQSGSNQHSPAYRQGLADRLRWESWIASQSGAFYAGAAYWASHRSLQHPMGCEGAAGPTTAAAWTQGCMAAQQQLTAADLQRRTIPEYRLGWNSLPPVPLPPASPTQSDRSPEPSTPLPMSAPPSTPAPDPLPTPDDASGGSDARLAGDASAPIPQTTPPPPPKSGPSAIAEGFLIIAGLLGIYFIPAELAFSRKKRNAPAVFALNLFLGWTFIGWVLALVWSLTADP